MFDGVRQHPTAVVIPRQDPKRDRRYTPQSNTFETPVVEQETSPAPVPYTTFYGVGRDAAHAPTPRRTYIHLAIQDKLSIMAQHFGVAKVPSALVVSMNTGRQNPVRERSNIIRPNQTTLGDKATVDPGFSYAPQYAKLI